MYKLSMLFILGVIIAALSSGCSTVGEAINPYSADFKCQMTENGRCISMTGAYLGSLQRDPGNTRNGKNGKGAKNMKNGNPADPPVIANSETAYQEALFKKLSNLLDEPTTPVIAPPKVMRVLLLPYKAEKDLFMYRYVYFVVDDYAWVLTNDLPGGK